MIYFFFFFFGCLFGLISAPSLYFFIIKPNCCLSSLWPLLPNSKNPNRVPPRTTQVSSKTTQIFILVLFKKKNTIGFT